MACSSKQTSCRVDWGRGAVERARPAIPVLKKDSKDLSGDGQPFYGFRVCHGEAGLAEALAPVKYIRLEISGPDTIEIAVLQKIDGKAFGALLGPRQSERAA
jgi:hypothetical protein